MSSSGVEEPLQLQVEYDTLVNSLTELQGKHSGQCVKHEAIRAVLERVGSCNDVRIALRSDLEAKTIEAARVKGIHTSMAASFTTTLQTAVAAEKQKTKQALADLNTTMQDVTAKLNEGKQEEEALLGECQALRQDLITAQESYNNAAKALNTALAYRTSLIMDIDSVTAQERECVQATARIKQQTTELQVRIKEDARAARRRARELVDTTLAVQSKARELKQEHDERDARVVKLAGELERTHDALVQENRQLGAVLPQVEAERAELRAMADDLRARALALAADKEQRQAETAAVRAEVARKQREHAAEMKRLRQAEEHCYDKAAHHRNTAKQRAAEHKKVVSRRRRLEKERAKRERVVDGLRTRAAEAREEMRWKGDEVGKLTQECVQLMGEEQEVRKQASVVVMAHTARLDKLTREHEAERRMRQQLEVQLEAAQRHLDEDTVAFHTRRDALQEQLDTRTAQARVLGEDVAVRQGKLDAATAECGRLGSAIPRLHAQREERQRQHGVRMRSLAAEVTGLEGAARRLTMQADELQVPIDELQVQCTHARKEVAELRAGEERRRQQLETRDQALRAMAEEVQRVQGPHAEATQHLRSTEEAKAKLDRQQADKEALLEHRLALVQKKHDMVSGHQQRLEDALARLRHDNAFARATAREATENVARLRAELRAISAATTRAATGSARGRADTHTRVEGSSGCNRHSNSSGGNKDSNGNGNSNSNSNDNSNSNSNDSNYGNSAGRGEVNAGGSSGQGTKRGRPAVAATASSAFDVDASSLSFALVDEGRAEMARRQAAIGNLHAALHASTTAITKIKAQLDRVVARTAGAIASAT